MKVLIIGGDKRNLYMINSFKDKDLDVTGFNMIDDIGNIPFEDIDISLYDVVIFPVDGIHKDCSITTKFNDEQIIIPSNFFSKTKKGVYIFSGINTPILQKMCKGLNYLKLLEYDDVVKKNGILTAEGIIADLIYNTPYSIYDTKILVLGCGNIGKPLINYLNNMGSTVYVGVKEYKDYMEQNNSFFTNKDIKDYLNIVDIVINTVPDRIIDKEILSEIKNKPYILDVSSVPYGIDYDEAKKMDLNIKQLPGIPGKVSPKSASLILSKKINNIVKEV